MRFLDEDLISGFESYFISPLESLDYFFYGFSCLLNFFSKARTGEFFRNQLTIPSQKYDSKFYEKFFFN